MKFQYDFPPSNSIFKRVGSGWFSCCQPWYVNISNCPWESSCLMGSVFHPTLKNGRNLWSVPWAALRTKCTEAPLPQGLTAHKISGICLRNLLGQVFHPHPPEAVSILVHQLPNHNANNCQRLHLSDWSATCFDTWPQS